MDLAYSYGNDGVGGNALALVNPAGKLCQPGRAIIDSACRMAQGFIRNWNKKTESSPIAYVTKEERPSFAICIHQGNAGTMIKMKNICNCDQRLAYEAISMVMKFGPTESIREKAAEELQKYDILSGSR